MRAAAREAESHHRPVIAAALDTAMVGVAPDGSTTKPIGQGAGLGLSMIYGFAKQSGGQARIRSQVCFGTTISLYLPRADTPPPIAEAEAALLPRARRLPRPGHGDDRQAFRSTCSPHAPAR